MASLEQLLLEENLPTKKNENYRYTSLKDVELNRTPKLKTHLPALPEYLFQSDEMTTASFVERSNSDILSISSKLDADSGVLITDLKTFSNHEASADLGSLGVPEIFADDVFAQLSASRSLNTAVVYVPRNTKVEGTLRGLHYFEEDSSTFFTRTLIIVDEHSELTYVDEFLGKGLLNGKSPLACGLVQMIVAPNARLKYAQSQNFGPSVQCFLRQSVKAAKNAQVEVISAVSGGCKNQIRTELECQEKGSDIYLLSAVRGDDRQHFDFWTTAHHTVPDTRSKLEHYTVMADHARAVFNGNIMISAKAFRTDAIQQNRNMLLSPKAAVDTFPKLEIATDEVKCAHGATVVPVSQDQVYYLQSRGISSAEAELMIINGFTEPIIQRIPSEVVSNRIREAFTHKHALAESAQKKGL